jgi:integrase
MASLARWSGEEVDPRTKGKAAEVLTRLKAAVDAKRYQAEGESRSLGSGQRFREFVREWIKHHATERHLTANSMGAMLDVLVEKFGDWTLDQLEQDRIAIERWLNAAQKERKWKDNTWNKYRGMLHRLFQRAVEWGYMKTNPVTFIKNKVGTNSRTEVRLLEDPEERLLAACDRLDEAQHHRRRAKLNWQQVREIRARAKAGESQKALAEGFKVSATTVSQVVSDAIWKADAPTGTCGREMRRRLIAAVDLGVRVTELLSITLPMIKPVPERFERDGKTYEVFVISLPAPVTKGGKTTGKVEDVYAGTERLKQELTRRRFQLRGNPPDKQYVFGREDGSRIKRFDDTWHRLFGLAGLDWGRKKGLVWHTLRHEFCSRMVERSGDPVVAQRLARHKDLRTTMTYMHARPENLLAAAVGLSRRS